MNFMVETDSTTIGLIKMVILKSCSAQSNNDVRDEILVAMKSVLRYSLEMLCRLRLLAGRCPNSGVPAGCSVFRVSVVRSSLTTTGASSLGSAGTREIFGGKQRSLGVTSGHQKSPGGY